MSSAVTRLRHALATLHRWLGLGGSLLFVAWFVSGFAMMYVQMPSLQSSELWWRAAPALETSGVAATEVLSPAEVLARANVAGPLRRLSLDARSGVPAWRLELADGSVLMHDARDGAALGPVTVENAAECAQAWLRRAEAASASRMAAAADRLRFEGTFDVDQWTLGGAFAAHRPFYRFAVDDSAGTEIYVAQRTSRVVQQTTRKERLLATLGPVVHWIYPTALRRHAAAWNRLVVWLSALGVLVAASGLVTGIWASVRARRQSSSLSTYGAGWLRWHHLFGLVFGLFTFTWVLSGLLSMSPFDWQGSTSPSADLRRQFAGSGNRWADFVKTPAAAIEELGKELELKELEARFVGARPYWIGYESGGRSLALPADGPPTRVTSELDTGVLHELARGAFGDADLVEWQRLEDYDGLYTSKRTFQGGRRLPVYRARFDDAERTVLYVDPQRGAPVAVFDRRARLDRVLYRGLHSWDLWDFHNRRPWWDFVVGLALLGGTLSSITGVVLTVRWLKRR